MPKQQSSHWRCSAHFRLSHRCIPSQHSPPFDVSSPGNGGLVSSKASSCSNLTVNSVVLEMPSVPHQSEGSMGGAYKRRGLLDCGTQTGECLSLARDARPCRCLPSKGHEDSVILVSLTAQSYASSAPKATAVTWPSLLVSREAAGGLLGVKEPQFPYPV